jgi:hypothetical protein
MPVFKGFVQSGSTTAESQVFNIPATIKSFYLYNDFAGANDVIISIFRNSPAEEIIVFNKEYTTKESYSTNIPILMLPGYQIKITAPKDLYFYFTIE